MINLSLDRFRRGNYNLEKQQPDMNNSYSDTMVHQLPSTFTAQLYSILLAVKCMHDWEDGCEIKVGFHKTEISRRCGFHFSHTIFEEMNRTFYRQVVVYLIYHRMHTRV